MNFRQDNEDNQSLYQWFSPDNNNLHNEVRSDLEVDYHSIYSNFRSPNVVKSFISDLGTHKDYSKALIATVSEESVGTDIPLTNEDDENYAENSSIEVIERVNSLPLTPSFIERVYYLMNNGEFENLNLLMEERAKNDCEFILYKPRSQENFVGKGIFSKFIQSVYETCSDLLMGVPVIKYHGKGRSNRIIESSYAFDCTYPLIEGMHLKSFRDDNYRQSYDFINDTVDKLATQKKIEKFRRILSEANESNKLISVSGRGGLHFYVDEFSNRIGKIKLSLNVTHIYRCKHLKLSD